MKPNILPNLVFRVPKFSWKDTLKDSWEELKIDISISSPAFFDVIKDLAYSDLAKLSAKEQFTIWKYFNRARFRATPFGTFGAFGMAQCDEKAQEPIKLKGDFIQHRFVNWPHKEKLLKSPKEILKGDPILTCNGTYYLTGADSIRFICINEKQFELAEIQSDATVLSILSLLKEKRKKSFIFSHFSELISREDLEELLEDMLSLQLLISENEPNIIGEDYFTRRSARDIIDSTPYIISEAPTQESKINSSVFRNIPQLIDLLQRNVTPQSDKTLNEFRNRFVKKFDQDEVPIMMALDPEIGIGYDELEQSGSSSEFAASLKYKAKKETNNALKEFKARIYKLLNQGVESKQVINLESAFDTHNPEQGIIPNSMSLVVQVLDDKVYVENMGGATTNALNGRFTLASNDLLESCIATAKREAEANPDVLFFDVAYMGEANVDNINRRAAIYNHQISILNYDLSNEPLALSDILVSVRDNQVVLRSRSLGKRLIPRIATAYNYSRSDLSLFRLLCDLQHQGIHSYLLPDIENWFPEKVNFPRVEYKNIIVSPAKWKIPTSELPKKDEDLVNFFAERCISKIFRCGLSDQLLCFDTTLEEDRTSFLTYASKHKDLVLEEYFEVSNPSIVDKNGQPLVAQYILSLEHKENIYSAISTKNERIVGENTVQSNFLPGSEWLYFEIYCHQQRSNAVLKGPILHLIEAVQNQLEQWFFIRYDENGDHLRLRLKLKDMKDFQLVVGHLYENIRDWAEIGIISDVQLKTYRRELARYGTDLIDQVEKHFYVDSKLVCYNLIDLESDFVKYRYAVEVAKRILGSVFEPYEALHIVTQVSDAFNKEHELEAIDFKALNKEYGDYLKFECSNNLADSDEFSQSFITLLKLSGTRSPVLFSDLFHMHVNRIFHDLQRTHELIIYYFLLKDLQREKALKRAKI